MKRLVCILLIMIMAVTTVSCAGGEQQSQKAEKTYTFTDSEGTSVSVSGKPKKVAILFSSFADIWQSVGGTIDITVSESVERGFATEKAIIVEAGSGHSAIDMETIVAEKPDLVIGTLDYESQCEAVAFCRNAGIPSALFQMESVDDYLKVLKIFCDLMGNEQAYQELGANMKGQIDELLGNLPEQETPKKILFVRAGSAAKFTKAKTSEEHFAATMLKELGAENIADSNSELTGTLSLEIILEQNPDVLFITTMGDEEEAKSYMDSLLATDGWKELDCVKNGQCIYLPKDLFHYKPNSKWLDAYQYLESIIYAEK